MHLALNIGLWSVTSPGDEGVEGRAFGGGSGEAGHIMVSLIFLKSQVINLARSGESSAIMPLTTQDDMLQDPRQAGALTLNEALLLSRREIARWGNDIDDDCDDWNAAKTAHLVFEIYDRVRKVEKIASIEARTERISSAASLI